MSQLAGTTRAPTLSAQARAFASDIKLAHTVFAMPFALLSAFLAAGGAPPAGVLLLIVACMVLARSFAMGMNRLLDAELDARNPRTAGRALPAGRMTRRFAWAVVAACAVAFIAATALFGTIHGNWAPLAASTPVLAFVGAYPLLKRFTRWVHYYLGAALALAPLCAWVAVAGTLAPAPALLGLAVLCWTAGFDILYACQDVGSDRATGVHSMPARLGVGAALWVARATHALAAALLLALPAAAPGLGGLYLVGAGVAAILLTVEHRLVRADDLSKITLAFFTLNGMVSLVVGALGVADVLL